MLKCVGYNWSIGNSEIEGRSVSWDNLVLHMLSEDNPEVFGYECSQVKLKRSEVSRILGNLSPDEILGRYVVMNSGLVRGRIVITKISLLDSGE